MSVSDRWHHVWWSGSVFVVTVFRWWDVIQLPDVDQLASVHLEMHELYPNKCPKGQLGGPPPSHGLIFGPESLEDNLACCRLQTDEIQL